MLTLVRVVPYYVLQNVANFMIFLWLKRFFILCLLLSCFISSLALIWVRHENRLLFIELQKLQQQNDQLSETWGRLQLEQSSWAQHQRIERIAREQLQMTFPSPQQTIVIKP